MLTFPEFVKPAITAILVLQIGLGTTFVYNVMIILYKNIKLFTH